MGNDRIVKIENSVSEFESKKITPLFWKYTFTAFLGFAVVGVSVVADGIFVGNGIGSLGLAAIGIIAPFWTITVALTGLFGIGGSTLAAIKLGEGEVEDARTIYGTVITFSLYFGVVIASLVLLNVEGVLRLLGATPEIMPYAKAYAIPFLIGAPVCITGGTAYYFGRVDERPVASAVAYVVPAIICMLSEYYMVFVLDVGMKGSSIAWILCAGLCIFLIPYFHLRKATFRLKPSDFYQIKFKIIWNAAKIGFAYFAIQVCTSLSTIIINNQIVKYGGGADSIAAFGIINAYIAYIFTLISTSFIGGIQPIVSYNIGAKLYKRVAQLLRSSSIQTTIILIVMIAGAFLFSESIIKFFVDDTNGLIETTQEIMYIFLALYAFGSLSQLAGGYYMAIENNRLAVLNGVARIILFAVPLLFILPQFFGLLGVWLAQPIADLLSFAMALIFIIKEYKKLIKKAE